MTTVKKKKNKKNMMRNLPVCSLVKILFQILWVYRKETVIEVPWAPALGCFVSYFLFSKQQHYTRQLHNEALWSL